MDDWKRESNILMSFTSSPYLSSGTPKQTACVISGWDKRTASTSIGDIFSPKIHAKSTVVNPLQVPDNAINICVT